MRPRKRTLTKVHFKKVKQEKRLQDNSKHSCLRLINGAIFKDSVIYALVRNFPLGTIRKSGG